MHLALFGKGRTADLSADCLAQYHNVLRVNDWVPNAHVYAVDFPHVLRRVCDHFELLGQKEFLLAPQPVFMGNGAAAMRYTQPIPVGMAVIADCVPCAKNRDDAVRQRTFRLMKKYNMPMFDYHSSPWLVNIERMRNLTGEAAVDVTNWYMNRHHAAPASLLHQHAVVMRTGDGDVNLLMADKDTLIASVELSGLESFEAWLRRQPWLMK